MKNPLQLLFTFTFCILLTSSMLNPGKNIHLWDDIFDYFFLGAQLKEPFGKYAADHRKVRRIYSKRLELAYFLYTFFAAFRIALGIDYETVICLLFGNSLLDLLCPGFLFDLHCRGNPLNQEKRLAAKVRPGLVKIL